MYKNFFKRFFDFFLSLGGFIFLLPLFILITLCLFIANDGKPFFFQRRPGLHAKIFEIVKFKTMNDRKDKDGNLLPMAERITSFGAFLRKTSLDEIPQLLNVIKGDMSLIGPRPLLEEYLPLYTQRQNSRHHVRPGVTGWAQVNGRNAITLKDKLEKDIWYVDNISFKLDCIILIKTVKKIFLKSDIAYSEPKVLPSDFLD